MIDHLDRRIQALQQRLQRRRHADDHPGAERNNHRHIAAELDRIAQALFRIQHDRLAGDVGLPVPQRALADVPAERLWQVGERLGLHS